MFFERARLNRLRKNYHQRAVLKMEQLYSLPGNSAAKGFVTGHGFSHADNSRRSKRGFSP
jgi:hypothetical protein